MIRTLVVYPDIEGREQVLDSLAQQPDVTLVGDCVYGDDAMAKIVTLQPDAVFVGTGALALPSLSASAWLRFGKLPYIVVLSDGARHAMEAFAINAVDYLLTPLDPMRLKVAISRLRRNIDADQLQDRKLDMDRLVRYLKEHVGEAPSNHQDERVLINFGGRLRILGTHNIRYLRANVNHVDIHMTDGEVLQSASRIVELGSKLPADRFLRIRRSTIVNIEHVREARARKEHYEIVMDDDVTFRPGTTYKFKVRAALVRKLGFMSGGYADPLESVV